MRIYASMYSMYMNKRQKQKLSDRGIEYVQVGGDSLWRIVYDEGRAHYAPSYWQDLEFNHMLSEVTKYDGWIGDYLAELGLEELKEHSDSFTFKPIV